MAEQEPVQPEAPIKTKAEIFAEDPDRFIDKNTLIIALMRTPQGPAVYFVPRSRQEMITTKGEIDALIAKEIFMFDMRADKLREGQIAKPEGGIISAARNRMFKHKR